MAVTGESIQLENLLLGENPTLQNITEGRNICFSLTQSGFGEKEGKDSLKDKTLQEHLLLKQVKRQFILHAIISD